MKLLAACAWFARGTAAALVLLIAAATLIAQQSAPVSSDLRFEVASLKPTTGPQKTGGIRPAPGGRRYEAINCPIQTMLQVAYQVRSEQIVGGPAWLATDHFDMNAEADKPASLDELHIMLINLLKDRLKLQFHHEKREMPAYALVVGKDGPKNLSPHDAANAGEPWIDETAEKFLHIRMKATSSSMDYFAFRLSPSVDRPIVNLTNLHGGYDFDLEYTRQLPPGFPEGRKINGEEPDTSGPTVFGALKQHLGLELKAQKGSVDVLVIDHVEKPDEN